MSANVGPIFQQARSTQPEAFPLAQATITCNPAAGVGGNGPDCLGQGAYTGSPIIGFPTIVYPVQLYGTVTKANVVSTDQSRFSFKVDHKLTQKDQLAFVYLFDDVQSIDNNGGAASTIGAGDVIPNRAQNVSVSWTRTLVEYSAESGPGWRISGGWQTSPRRMRLISHLFLHSWIPLEPVWAPVLRSRSSSLTTSSSTRTISPLHTANTT